MGGEGGDSWQCGEEEGIEEESGDGVFSEGEGGEDAIEGVEEAGGDAGGQHIPWEPGVLQSQSGDQEASQGDEGQGEEFSI